MLEWRLKWWQSGLVGSLIGLGAFYCWRSVPRDHAPNCSQEAFFKAAQNWRKGEPPPFKDLLIAPQSDGAYTVTGLRFVWEDQALRSFVMEIPRQGDSMGGKNRIMGQYAAMGFMRTLRNYANQDFWLRYNYQWWREPRIWIWGYPAIGALVLGGIIPFLTVLWGGGTRSDPEKQYDLDRFSGHLNDTTSSPTVAPIAESEQLDAAISAAQQPSASSADSNATLSTSPQNVPARKLDNKPLLEPSPTTVEKKKDFGGKFYPTEVHHDEPKADSETERSS
jgi:hypothetical protein